MPWALPVLATRIDILTWLLDFDETGVACISDIEKAARPAAGVADDWLELVPEDDEVEVPEEDEDDVVVVVVVGVVVVVVVDAAPTATEYVALAVCDEVSVTRIVKLYVEAAVGVPASAPELLSESPEGRLPEETVHVYEPDPPEADIYMEYEAPTVPPGMLVVLMETLEDAAVLMVTV
jgi:hypothetical protein